MAVIEVYITTCIGGKGFYLRAISSLIYFIRLQRESVEMKDAPEKWDHQEIKELWEFKGPRDRQGPG